MRITGGDARGRIIDAPQGRDTRPTTEKVREAVFSMLGGTLEGDTVLDVFGGSGALGLESISRGAESAVIVDSSRKAAGIIKKNAAALGYGDRVSIICRDWKQALPEIIERRFSIVFIDPPYKLTQEYRAVTDALIGRDMLRPRAILVLECAKGADIGTLNERLTPLKPHTYGDTVVTLYRYEGSDT